MVLISSSGNKVFTVISSRSFQRIAFAWSSPGSVKPKRNLDYLTQFNSTASAAKPITEFQTPVAPGLLASLENNGVFKLTVNRPEKANAFTLDMYKSLGELINEANSDPRARIIVIAANGKFFTAGNELSNFDGKEEAARNMSTVVRGFIESLIDLRKPLLAFVNGPAIGIGATILPHCDGVYAAKSAYLLTPFTKLGICAEACSSYLFPRILGKTKANDMLMFGPRMSADEAAAHGLVTNVFPDESFQSDSEKIIESVSQLPYKALLTTKELLRGPEREKLHSINRIEFDKIAELTAGEECKAAIQALRASMKK